MSASDKDIYEATAIACIVGACLGGIATLVLFAIAADAQSLMIAGLALMLAAVTGTCGWGATHFGQRLNIDWVHSGTREHVLTIRQKRLLRRKRGEVVLEQALIEVEHERQNIVHRQIEAANDPEKPPHKTQWSPTESTRPQLRGGDDPW